MLVRHVTLWILFLSAASIDVSEDILAVLSRTRERKAEEEEAAKYKLLAELNALRLVSPATPSRASCYIEFPLELADRSFEDSEEELQSPQDGWPQKLVDEIWADEELSGDVELPPEELAVLNSNASHYVGCRPSTFGESVHDYENVFGDSQLGLNADDVYIDLGGGVGKAVIHNFLKFNVARALSIELSATRFNRSCKALHRLQELAQDARQCGEECRQRMASTGHLEMLHQNFLDVNLSRATVVTIWSACLSHEVMMQLQRKLLQELQPGSRIFDRGEGWSNPNRPLNLSSYRPLLSHDSRFALVLNGKVFKFIGSMEPLGVIYRIEAHQEVPQDVEL